MWVILGMAAIAILYIGARGSPTVLHGTSGQGMDIVSEPKLPKSGFTWKYRAISVTSGKPAVLARGRQETIVMLMASWCLYCAYVDKWVWPTIWKTPGLVLDIVDSTQQSGIGNPGPKYPPFEGKDHIGPIVGIARLRKTMEKYMRKFDLKRKNVHVYVDPTAGEYWGIQAFPTILVVNKQGHLAKRINGVITREQARSLILVGRSK
jgi:thiol-disulfide isomerase/thioredoxin